MEDEKKNVTLQFDLPLKEWSELKYVMKSKGYNSWKDLLIGEFLDDK